MTNREPTPSWREAKEPEAKAHHSTSVEIEPTFNLPPPPKINFEPKSIFASDLKNPSELDFPFIDPLHGGYASNETSSFFSILRLFSTL